MAQETYTKEQFWGQLDALGEDTVRVRLATHAYGDGGDRRALVEEWLRRQNQRRATEESDRSAAASAEQIRIARSAKNAAWAAAMAAIIAAIFAAISIAISLS